MSSFGFESTDGVVRGFRAADPEEALRSEAEAPGFPAHARLDTETRGVVAARKSGLSDLPTIGGKAAKVRSSCASRSARFRLRPNRPFAVPWLHSLEHFERSGARACSTSSCQDHRIFAPTHVFRERA